MQFKKLDESESKKLCCVCDSEMAKYEIFNEGHLRLFWCLPGDGDICFCETCAKKLLNQMKEVIDN